MSAPPDVGQVASARRFISQHPLGLFHLLLGATVLLLALGLVMVMSASSIVSLRLHDSVYTLAQRQALFAVVGLTSMVVASRITVRLWRGFAWPTLVVAFVLLIAVLLIGVEVSGDRKSVV